MRSFTVDGSFARSSALVDWRSASASARLQQPLGEASTSDLIDLLSGRLGSASVAPAAAGSLPLRANATLVMLVRNSEANDAAAAIRQLEDRFNSRYHYPWVFLNDEPFDENFIQCVPIILARHYCLYFSPKFSAIFWFEVYRRHVMLRLTWTDFAIISQLVPD